MRLRTLLGSLVLLAVAAECRAAPLLLPRAGQIGIGLQGQFGALLDSGELARAFDSGGGYGLRLRYRMRYGRAMGVSFENQNFDAVGVAIENDVPRSMRVTLQGVDLYQMSDPRERTQRYLSVGLGLYQTSLKLPDGQIKYLLQPDGLYLGAGAGIERFFWRSWAFDVSARYLALLHEGKANHDVQGSVGVIFYASY